MVQIRFGLNTFQTFGFRFGSGSVAPKFKGSGSVQVHKFEILKVRFRFNDFKLKQFRFGSGSPKNSGFYRFAVQVRVRFDFLVKTDFSTIFLSQAVRVI